MSKFLSIVLASVLSFLLFVCMTLLIEPNQVQAVPVEKQPPVVIHYLEKDDKVKLNVRKLPEKPKEHEKPKVVKTTIDADKKRPRVASVDFRFPKISSNDIGNIGLPVIGGNSGSGELSPRVRINPTYPRVAAFEGIEGFVTLSFDISAMGTTENIRVTASSPRNMFEKNARKALRKWKFSPKIVDKKAVAVPDQTITLQFRLEKEFF